MRFRTAFRMLAFLFATLIGATLSSASQEPDASAEQIRSAIQAGNVDAAIADARRAVAQFPQVSELHQLLGAALFKKGLNAEAREAFRRAIALDADLPQNYYNLALVELSERKYAEATRLLETFVKLEPDNALARVMLGRAYHNLNRTVPAIEQFRLAIGLAPQLPLVHYHLGFAYQSEGNLSAALAEYEQEIRLNPGFFEPYYLAGNIRLGRGNLAEAETLFRKGIGLRPEAAQAHYGLARVLQEKADLAGAEAELKRVIELKPAHVEAHYTLARVYQQLGRKSDAAREFKIVAEIHASEARSSSGIAGGREP